MTMMPLPKVNWWAYFGQLALISFGLIVVFAVLYWSVDALNWGWLLNRSGEREQSFGDFLYFSMGTFFRIGYGDQIAFGVSRWLVGLEAFSNYCVEIMFIIHTISMALRKYIASKFREQLEQTFTR